MASDDVNLSVVKVNLLYRLKQLRALAMDTVPTDAACLYWYCEQHADASEWYRLLAVVLWLTEQDDAGFMINMKRSANARIALLRAAKGSPDPEFGRLTHQGCNGAFFDALAAGAVDLAEELAVLSTDAFNPKFEYEEDYCYSRLLVCLVLKQTGKEELLKRFFELVEKDDRVPRYAVCNALISGDEPGFFEALQNLLLEHEAYYANESVAARMNPEQLGAEKHLCVEAMGLCFLAKMNGFSMLDSYALIPDVVCD